MILEIIKSFLIWASVWAVFAIFKTPIPAPPTIAWVMAILWVTIWFILITKLISFYG